MSTKFHFVLSRHPVDGMQLAMKIGKPPRDNARPLIITTFGGASAGVAFGFNIPEGYPGLAGLLHGAPADLSVEIERNKRSFDVIFPANRLGPEDGLAEYIDRIRERVDGVERVLICITYPRLAIDLPPLDPEDKVSAFWEARDFLDQATVRHLEDLTERLEHHPAKFLGFHLYTRSPGAIEKIAKISHAITQTVGLEPAGQLLQI